MTSLRVAFIGTPARSFFCASHHASKSAGSGVNFAILSTSAAAPPSKNTPLTFLCQSGAPGAGLSRETTFPSASFTYASSLTNPGLPIFVFTLQISPDLNGAEPFST